MNEEIRQSELKDEAEELESCEKPCQPLGCGMCAGYWQRMIEDGLWQSGKGWTEKSWKR